MNNDDIDYNSHFSVDVDIETPWGDAHIHCDDD